MMPFYWFLSPPSELVPIDQWEPFLSEILSVLLLLSGLAVVVLVAVYRWQIPKFKIRQVADPFRVPSRAWWLLWGFWALLPAAGYGVYYWLKFNDLAVAVPELVEIVPVWGVVSAVLTCWLLILLVFQVLLWVPGITPKKFLYHPRWPWRLRPHKLRSTVVTARS
jgi:hypothetical protein